MVALVRDLAHHIGDASLAKGTAEQLSAALEEPHPACRGLVAEEQGRIVGICLYSIIYSTWRGLPGIYVIDLYVRPETRRGRLGERLLAHAAREGWRRGCRFFRLEVDAGNAGAMRFYQRLGFKTLERDRCFALDQAGFEALASTAEPAVGAE